MPNLDDAGFNLCRIVDDISEDLEYTKYLDMMELQDETNYMEGYEDVESDEYWGTHFSYGDD